MNATNLGDLRFHKCPVEVCTKRVRSDKLMCYEHWRMVPPRIQAEVYRLWQNAPASKEYLFARQGAITYVDRKLQ